MIMCPSQLLDHPWLNKSRPVTNNQLDWSARENENIRDDCSARVSETSVADVQGQLVRPWIFWSQKNRTWDDAGYRYSAVSRNAHAAIDKRFNENHANMILKFCCVVQGWKHAETGKEQAILISMPGGEKKSSPLLANLYFWARKGGTKLLSQFKYIEFFCLFFFFSFFSEIVSPCQYVALPGFF